MHDRLAPDCWDVCTYISVLIVFCVVEHLLDTDERPLGEVRRDLAPTLIVVRGHVGKGEVGVSVSCEWWWRRWWWMRASKICERLKRKKSVGCRVRKGLGHGQGEADLNRVQFGCSCWTRPRCERPDWIKARSRRALVGMACRCRRSKWGGVVKEGRCAALR